MKFGNDVFVLANRLRQSVQHETLTIDDGESVSLLLWWTFILEHATAMDIDPNKLALDQLEAFLTYAVPAISLRKRVN